ncbi:MAG TPA: M14 family metallocarboxypeptidase [Opitutaceae bacterium]|nr:M14 family metallocarboxypeptidase [Opitutaceae bacterium]
MATTSPLSPGGFHREFSAASRAAGFVVEPFGEVHGHPLIACTKRASRPRPRLYLSAGIHSDEPAPPQALLRLLEEGFFDARCEWFLCPLLNPTGLAAGTRENHERRDLNRDYRSPQAVETKAHVAWLRRQPPFDLTLCLHEDWEASGFYLYELNSDHRPSLAEPVVAAVSRVCPVEFAATIDGRPAQGGIIRPDDDPAKRELWPEAIYLRAHHTRLGYTLETPSSLPLPQRILAHVTAVATAIACFLPSPPGRAG